MGQGTSDGYWEEVWGVSINSLQGSRSLSRTAIGVGPGLCELPRKPLLGTSVNMDKKRKTEGLRLRLVLSSCSVA